MKIRFSTSLVGCFLLGITLLSRELIPILIINIFINLSCFGIYCWMVYKDNNDLEEEDENKEK
jgi:Ca2+/Na+ antiporter